MNNKSIISQFKLTQKLLELHDANVFKVKAYASVVYVLENYAGEIISNYQSLGLNKGMVDKIDEIINTSTFSELTELLDKTPSGVIDMLNVKGIGPKKVRSLWIDLGIETVKDLLKACKENKVAQAKGFGQKTQDQIIESIEYQLANEGSHRYADIIPLLESIETSVQNIFSLWSRVGQTERVMPVIDHAEWIVGTIDEKIYDELKSKIAADWNEKLSHPFLLSGEIKQHKLSIAIHFCKTEAYISKKLILTASENHLQIPVNQGKSFYNIIKNGTFLTEEEAYKSIGYQYIPAEMREGLVEELFTLDKNLPNFITLPDLKGTLHNHCTYSDGAHSLEQMAKYAEQIGLTYLGISDHSQSAAYAGGLIEEKIIEQHKEIEQLNASNPDFKIFKGIESDILADGSLDYSEDILKTFDFIVASIHSGMNMTEEVATNRLIKAIENPYTTILGHPTGRLLTTRAGYPINHTKIIDACAANGVSIEINASPWRLDIDWQWIPYCMEKGVMISINPDAHEMMGYHDMYFGVMSGRKGGLIKELTLNALTKEEIDLYFKKKK